MQIPQSEMTFAICIDNTDYAAALERRKIYQVIPDHTAALHGLLRIIDESGEDYLYPSIYFIPVNFSPSIQEAIVRAI